MTSYIYNMVDTWASGGGPYTSIKMDATDNDTGSASLLMDLQVGGVSQSGIDKNGNAHFGTYRGFIGAYGGQTYSGSPSGTSVYLPQLGGFTFYNSNGGSLGGRTIDTILTRRGAANLRLGAADAASGVQAQTLSVQSITGTDASAAAYPFTITGSQGTGTGAGGSIIFQVAPAGSSGASQNALATFLEATSARAFNLYNTTDVTTNFERGKIAWESNVLCIGTAKGGTGTARALEFQTDGATRLTIPSNGGVWTTSGQFFHFRASANTSASVLSPADGVMTLGNWNADNFNRLQFGGTTSSFPAIKRSSTTLQVVLANDTGFAPVQGKLTTDTAYTAGAPTATGYLVVYDSAGTAYRIPAVLN